MTSFNIVNNQIKDDVVQHLSEALKVNEVILSSM